jgi:enoyl-CoA hydratase
MNDWVRFSERDAHCLLTMDDGKANALGFDLLAGLRSGLDRAQASGKPLVIAGRPGRFSAGFDLTVMARRDRQTEQLLREGAELATRLFAFPTPVVAAVTGHAIAMGALLCLSVDYRVGSEGDYKLGLNEVAIGMTLPWFGVALARGRLANQWLTRAVDLAQVFPPQTAVSVGYLDEVSPADAAIERACALADTLAGLDMAAHAATKLRTRAATRAALDTAMQDDFL